MTRAAGIRPATAALLAVVLQWLLSAAACPRWCTTEHAATRRAAIEQRMGKRIHERHVGGPDYAWVGVRVVEHLDSHTCDPVDVVLFVGNTLDPDEARELAAHILTAADLAEGGAR